MKSSNQPASDLKNASFIERFKRIRKYTEDIIKPLSPEDCVVQPIIFASPQKWHLGHTTWFFETFILRDFQKQYMPFNDDYSYVFNSYYESEGERLLRVNRGLLTRPSLEEVLDYRQVITDKVVSLLEEQEEASADMLGLLELGMQHEQQHQELMYYDMKYVLGHSPLMPAYLESMSKSVDTSVKTSFLPVKEGVYEIGHDKEGAFCYDNELGQHKQYLHAYEIADALVTNREYLEFINDGGYTNFNYWMAEGWDWVNQNKIKAPLYWHERESWLQYTLNGVVEISPDDPVTHISYYEADAFATWKGCRLPTEFEWEVAAKQFANHKAGVFMEKETFHPVANQSNDFFGNAWEWTSSSYLPYPYFKKAAGAVGEYNGKFMINQKVLKGGSCVTPSDHIRLSYRNFFHPDLRWMFSGIRLARHT